MTIRSRSLGTKVSPYPARSGKLIASLLRTTSEALRVKITMTGRIERDGAAHGVPERQRAGVMRTL